MVSWYQVQLGLNEVNYIKKKTQNMVYSKEILLMVITIRVIATIRC